jgi:EAL domain-containing protein (putative c-di-GMP-specific phosphodiesterase class I)
VRDIVSDPVDRAMVGAIHAIGRALGIPTIAEWVENDAICDAVQALGIDYAQGYGIERPRLVGGPDPDGTPTRPAIEAVVAAAPFSSESAAAAG